MSARAPDHVRRLHSVPTRPDRPEELGDDDLVLLVAARSREAFAALVLRHQARVIAFCSRASGSAEIGRDLAQDVFLEVWRSAPRYRPEGKFVPWLFTQARNRLISRARRSSERAAAGTPSEAVATDASQLDALLAREQERLLREALATLPERERTAVLLHYQEGLTYEEIAPIVGSPVGTVRSWAFHALRRLRQRIAPRSEER